MRLLADSGKKKCHLQELQDYEIKEKYTRTEKKVRENEVVFVDEKEEQKIS
jgi:1,2-phenylacetyl-CoA epoxidase PaaB subunit